MSKKRFWPFWACPLKMSKKCPKVPFGASRQPVRKMSQKCPEHVLVLGLALETCPQNIKKMFQKCPETFSRHFPDMFWPIERWRPSAATQKGARALRARAPFWLSIGQKMSKKCLENVWGHYWDIFLTFSGHFSSANPSTRTFSRHFWGIFLGGCQEAPKGILGHCFDIFRGQAQNCQKRFFNIFLPF